MKSANGCREEILEAAEAIMAGRDRKVFTVKEVVDYLKAKGTVFAESTIRTHITSRFCANAPDNHPVTYEDFVRVGHGEYALKKR
jgi:hypothetical protein